MILGFKKRFIPLILDGTKIHTIREDKHGRWKAGNKIHFATGIRTKKYNQFSEGMCIFVQSITLVNHGNHVYCNIQTGENEYIHNDCVEHEHIKFYKGTFPAATKLLVDLCKNDGLSREDFKNWFIPKQGDKFTGKIIHWTDFRYDKETQITKDNKPDIECTNCQWQGYTENDTPEGGLLKRYKGDEGWDAYDPIDDPDDDGVWVCPKCFLPEDGGIMSI